MQLQPTRSLFPWPSISSGLIHILSILGLLVSAPSALLAERLDPAPGLVPRHIVPKETYSEIIEEHHRTDRLVVKFREGSGVRLRQGQLVSLLPAVDLRDVDAFFSQHPGIAATPHFHRPEAELDRAQITGQRQSGWQLANLNLYYQFHIPAAQQSASELEAILEEILALSSVEIAFAEPKASPAVMETTVTPSSSGGGDPTLATPDYTPIQGYLYDSPEGINAAAVWSHPGGRGAGVKLIDVEGDWQWTHEDLRAPFFTAGTPIDGWRNHGTAVVGEIVGQPNGTGIDGIASDVEIGGVAFGDFGVAGALDLAAANIDPGDIFLIELHAPGPRSPEGSGQYGYVPMEWWQDNFDAIQTAVANGRICVEAGGNGEQDLDEATYQNLFDRSVRNSGAILVGAGTPMGLIAEWFTNYGSRIDLNGWGSSITTTGYGTLQGGDEDQWYTSGFGGTSGASPIICGAVACLQGMCQAQWGVTLDRDTVVEILGSTGSPHSGSKLIGPRPDLVPARALMLAGVGQISGTITDATSGDPIPGATVHVVETERRITTDESGFFRVPLLSDSYTIEVASFFHETDTQVVVLGPGSFLGHSVSLDRRPVASITGTVRSESDIPVAGVPVILLDTPLEGDVTDLSGQYAIPGIPERSDYQAIFGPSPGRGAVLELFDIVDSALLEDTVLDISLPDAEDFESNDGSLSPAGGWQWGSPSAVGPATAFSGDKLWATRLDGDYANNATMTLLSPVLDFPEEADLHLSINHWYDIEAAYDGGLVEILFEGEWVDLEPVGGYPMVALSGLDWHAGFSGQSDGWEAAIFDLSDKISDGMRIRFRFGSDGGVSGPGWYIDDLAFDEALTPSSAPEDTGTLTARLEPAMPNPFSSGTEFRFRIATPGIASIRVFDTGGREVRQLPGGMISAGDHRISWDGRDNRGHEVASGTFYYSLEIDGRWIGTRRTVRIRD